MGGTLVDSNVLLDVLTQDARWFDWSSEALASAADKGPVYLNPVIYSEVSVRFSTVEALQDAFPAQDYRREAIPWAAAFLAGKAFLNHRSDKGTKSSTLPDFFIGAHAAVAGFELLTRDESRYRTYFSTVDLITPSGKRQSSP